MNRAARKYLLQLIEPLAEEARAKRLVVEKQEAADRQARKDREIARRQGLPAKNRARR